MGVCVSPNYWTGSSTIYSKDKRSREYTDYLPIPCGRCPNCRKRRVDDWVTRLVKEDERSLTSHFVTLTYSDRYLPKSENGIPTLKKEHLKEFFRVLRKKQKEKIRYYAVGEYGTEKRRPHYHIILFNVLDKKDIADSWSELKSTETIRNELGQVIGTKSNRIQKGTVHIDSVSQRAIGYCLKYIDKDKKVPERLWRNGKLQDYDFDDRLKEFATMSKKLGDNYLTDEMIAWHQADVERNYVVRNGRKYSLPTYYRNKIYSDEQKALQRMRIDVRSYEDKVTEYRRWKLMYPDLNMDDFNTYMDNKRATVYLRDNSLNKKRDFDD